MTSQAIRERRKWILRRALEWFAPALGKLLPLVLHVLIEILFTNGWRQSFAKLPILKLSLHKIAALPVLLHAQLLHVMYPCLVVTYSFVTRQVSIGQDVPIFLLLHDSYQRPNCTNRFVTRHENRARLGIYSRNLKNKNLCRFRYGCSTEHIKLQLLKESATNMNSK